MSYKLVHQKFGKNIGNLILEYLDDIKLLQKKRKNKLIYDLESYLNRRGNYCDFIGCKKMYFSPIGHEVKLLQETRDYEKMCEGLPLYTKD